MASSFSAQVGVRSDAPVSDSGAGGNLFCASSTSPPWLEHRRPSRSPLGRPPKPLRYRFLDAHTVEIALSKGQTTAIDADDLLLVRQHVWCSCWNPKTRSF